MRQIVDKCHNSIRRIMVFGLLVSLGLLTVWISIPSALAQTAANPGGEQTSAMRADENLQNTPTPNGAMTREEILALFEREARAAYQMNKEACQSLPAADKEVCLARARLQFDADMRYAQKRANQGY